MRTMFREWMLNEYGLMLEELTQIEFDAFYTEFIKANNLS